MRQGERICPDRQTIQQCAHLISDGVEEVPSLRCFFIAFRQPQRYLCYLCILCREPTLWLRTCTCFNMHMMMYTPMMRTATTAVVDFMSVQHSSHSNALLRTSKEAHNTNESSCRKTSNGVEPCISQVCLPGFSAAASRWADVRSGSNMGGMCTQPAAMKQDSSQSRTCKSS